MFPGGGPPVPNALGASASGKDVSQLQAKLSKGDQPLARFVRLCEGVNCVGDSGQSLLATFR